MRKAEHCERIGQRKIRLRTARDSNDTGVVWFRYQCCQIKNSSLDDGVLLLLTESNGSCCSRSNLRYIFLASTHWQERNVECVVCVRGGHTTMYSEHRSAQSTTKGIEGTALFFGRWIGKETKMRVFHYFRTAIPLNNTSHLRTNGSGSTCKRFSPIATIIQRRILS